MPRYPSIVKLQQKLNPNSNKSPIKKEDGIPGLIDKVLGEQQAAQELDDQCVKEGLMNKNGIVVFHVLERLKSTAGDDRGRLLNILRSLVSKESSLIWNALIRSIPLLAKNLTPSSGRST